MTSHGITWHHMTLHDITWHCMTSHDITQHFLFYTDTWVCYSEPHTCICTASLLKPQTEKLHWHSGKFKPPSHFVWVITSCDLVVYITQIVAYHTWWAWYVTLSFGTQGLYKLCTLACDANTLKYYHFDCRQDWTSLKSRYGLPTRPLQHTS